MKAVIKIILAPFKFLIFLLSLMYYVPRAWLSWLLKLDDKQMSRKTNLELGVAKADNFYYRLFGWN